MKRLFFVLVALAAILVADGAQAASSPIGCPLGDQSRCSVPLYVTGMSAAAGQLVRGSDTNIYRAVTATSSDPASATECGSNWQPVIIFANKTVNINAAGSAQCANLSAALSFMALTHIGQGATVTYKFADGTYTLGTTNYNLNHPFGRQFNITGNTSTPANVVFNFSGVTTTAANPRALFELTNGNGFGTINGITYNGPSNSVCTPNCQTAATGYTGAIFLKATGSGAYATVGPAVTMASGYSCVNAAEGATIVADGTTCSGTGDGGFWAYGPGSLVTAIGACGISAATPTIFAGAILLADNRGTIWADNGHFGGGASGAALFNDGDIRVGGAFFGRDCNNNSLSNSTADVYFHYSSYLNMEGGATYASGTSRRHAYINWIDGATFDDSSGGVLGADISNYLESAHVWENNSTLGRVAINKSGFAPFSNYASLTTQAFYMSSDSNVPLRFATNSKLAGGIDTSQNYFQVGSTSGTITLHPQAASGAWEWDWPTTAGSAGQVLTSQAGGGTAMTWTSISLPGTTSSIGGGALLVGTCASGTVAVTGSTTTMVVETTPVTYPGDAFYWRGYVSTNGTVTVNVCAAVAGTPTASAYNVRVIQ